MLRAAEGVRVAARAADGAVAVAAVPCGRRVDNFFAVVADADVAAAADAAVAVFSSTCLSVVGFSCCEMLNFFSIFFLYFLFYSFIFFYYFFCLFQKLNVSTSLMRNRAAQMRNGYKQFEAIK